MFDWLQPQSITLGCGVYHLLPPTRLRFDKKFSCSNLDKMVADSKTNQRITTDCDEHFLYIFNLSKATVSVSHFCRFRLFCLEAGRSEWCTDHLLTNLNCYEVHDFSSHYPVGFALRATGLSTSTKSHTTLL